MDILFLINLILSITLATFFLYKMVLGFVGIFWKKRYPEAKAEHTYAILIAGRNEEKVIGHLIDSIKLQNYDLSKLRVFVVADNCTDETAAVARQSGGGVDHPLLVDVFERHNLEKVGKGYALDFLFRQIRETYPDYVPDAFFVFDADNLLDPNYVREMNKAFDSGAEIVTSYRKPKNFHTNWITACSGMCFLRECRFMHRPRTVLGTSTFISGTGFLVSSQVLSFASGWNYQTMTEDIEFSVGEIIKGKKVMYCDDAIFYDEQPTTLKASWNQRMRWQKGFYQCFLGYFTALFNTLFSKNFFSKYEMLLMIFPFTPLTFFWGTFYFITRLSVGLTLAITHGVMSLALNFIITSLIYWGIAYLILFAYGMLILLCEQRRVKTTFWQKLKYALAFPIFLLTYVPISIICLFKRNVQWQRTTHNDARSIDELSQPAH
ncbi:MAG: glycosyltransferase [Prevotella sp.]|nr:glycosyltransferase [Prevotella sp.]